MCRSWITRSIVAALAAGPLLCATGTFAADPPANALLEQVIEQAARDGAAAQPVAPPIVRDLPVGEAKPHGGTAHNRGAELTIHSLVRRASYANLTPRDGRTLLILDTEWENLIPLTLVYERQVPTEYQIPDLGDHLYLVVNGSRVARVQPKDNTVPGHVPVKEFKLPRIGSRLRGNIVFEVPAGPIDSLELRFYDYAHGHMTIPLVERAGYVPQDPQPLAAPVQNEVVKAAVYGLRSEKEWNGQTAPDGQRFVIAELRAQSVFTMQGDATAFDPKARAGQTMKIGTVADWTEAYKYLQLVVDGEYGYAPDPTLTELPEAPRFLPDLMTGGSIVFLAPEQATSLELRCDFPNARTPEGQILRPRGLTLALEGRRPPLPPLKPVQKIEDDVFVVNILGQTTADGFAGAAAEDGERFVVLDVTVNNRGQNGEFFQTPEQLKLVNAAGAQMQIDPATYAGLRRPGELVWIPPGERRTFQVAYRFDASETQPRLAYTGISRADIVELPRLAPAAARPTQVAATPTPVTPMPDAPMDAPTDDAPPPTAPAMPAPAPAPAPVAMDQTIVVDGTHFPARVPVRPNIQPRGLEGVGLTPEQVNAAIDRGADALWNHILTKDLTERRMEFGAEREHVLAALALVHSGAHKRHADFDTHLRRFIARFKPNDENDTYQIGLYCMLIESYGDPTFFPQLRTATRWLVETQGKEGTWGYGRQVKDKTLFEDPAGARRVLRVAGGRPLDGSDVADPILRATPIDAGMDGDNSVSQYALLGLHAASRSRLKTSPDLWKRALEEHIERQNPRDGGWAYHGPGGSYGSMTCAGLCALAITRHELDASDPAIEERIERGLAWLNANFSVETHPNGSEQWLHYYLYSIERVGRILNTEFIGEHEWYPLGARYLIDKQTAEGLWAGKGEESDERIAASFALLFLTRATETLDAPQRSGPGILKTTVQLPPGRKIYIIMDASGSMLTEMDGRPKFEIAREAILALVNELPPNTQVALRAYGYRLRAIEPGANEDSKLLVPMAPLGDKTEILEILNGLRARGKTPLAYSLEQAKGELGGATVDEPLTVLLLTDGGEDTQPRRDPVAAAAALRDLPNVRVKIVGFDIDREDWSKQLQEMAAASNGQYLPAQQSAELMRELRSAVFETPDEFVLLDENRSELARGEFGQSVQLPAGKYIVRAIYAGRQFEEELWVNAGTTTAVTFDAINVATDPGVPAAPALPAPVATPAPGRAPARPTTPAPADAPARKFCTNCGAALAPNAKFCTSCGAKVGG